MALKLMYITNRPAVARIAEAAGVDRIFVDMEYIGKAARQGGMDTVQSHHTVEDVRAIRQTLTSAELMVRVNPIHDATADYGASEEEIDAVIAAGADIVMLPYFTTAEEVRRFVRAVNGRARTLPLLESAKAAAAVDEILAVPGIDEIFVGLNDLSLDLGKKFMFEPLADGTVDHLCVKFRHAGIPYGFGGIAAPGGGMLPSEYIIREHYRLGSTCVILSRSFCNTEKVTDLKKVGAVFTDGIRAVRAIEEECEEHSRFFLDNEREVAERVRRICAG